MERWTQALPIQVRRECGRGHPHDVDGVPLDLRRHAGKVIVRRLQTFLTFQYVPIAACLLEMPPDRLPQSTETIASLQHLKRPSAFPKPPSAGRIEMMLLMHSHLQHLLRIFFKCTTPSSSPPPPSFQDGTQGRC